MDQKLHSTYPGFEDSQAVGHAIEPILDVYVRNIVTAYRLASLCPEVMRAGSIWYRQHHRLIRDLADKYNVSVERVAGIIASYSGKTRWELTVKRANLFLAHHGEPPGSSHSRGAPEDHIVKAIKFYNGQPPEQVFKPNRNRGLEEFKEYNFIHNLLDPNDDEHVTIDRHSFSVAIGYALSEKEQAWLQRRGIYRTVADAYRQAARKLEIFPPSKLQAITWEYWRTTHSALSRGKSSLVSLEKLR